MGNLFIKAVSWTAKNLISFVLILGMLVLGSFLYGEYQKAKAALGSLAVLQASRPGLGNSLIDASKKIEAEFSIAVSGGLASPLVNALESMLERELLKKAPSSPEVFLARFLRRLTFSDLSAARNTVASSVLDR